MYETRQRSKRRTKKAKGKMKQYADFRAYVRPSGIQRGDTVVLKCDQSYRKSQTPYEPKPYKVISYKALLDDNRQSRRKGGDQKLVNLQARQAKLRSSRRQLNR